MKVIIQRTRRKKTEHGFVFNESPQIMTLCHNFQNIEKKGGCGCHRPTGHQRKVHLGTVAFGKHYSECEKKLNPCIPNTALTYSSGSFTERNSKCCEK